MNTYFMKLGYPFSGAVAGSVSSVSFAFVHDVFISDIWFSLVFMMIAGALCGICMGWSYGLLYNTHTAGNWIQYNTMYVILFIFLGIISVIVFDPKTTIAALIAANQPPRELIREAMPMTVVYTLIASILLTQFFGRSWRRFGAILLTTSILVLLLGLNISVIGLVSVPLGSFYLILELFGLILAINIVFAMVFYVMERKTFDSVKLPLNN